MRPLRECGRKRNNMEKMTRKMFFEAVVAGEISEEVKAMAEKELEKLAETSTKRAEKAAEKMAEYGPMVDRIVKEILGSEPMTSSQVGEILGISFQKAGVPLKMAVEQGLVQTVELKEKGRVKKGYVLA